MELNNKIISFLGDSITEGVGVVDIENNRYDMRLKKMYNLKEVYNYGIGGTRIAHQSVPSVSPRHDLCFCGRSYDLYADSNIIVVYGGVNDYLHGDAALGTEKDNTPLTFSGGVEFLMTFLKEKYNNAQIVFMTPAHCDFGYCDYNDEEPSTDERKNADAHPLVDYVNIIVEKGKKHNIPVLNLYNDLEIDPKIKEDYDKYTEDGLHFNDEGHKILAECLGRFLEKL